MPGNEAHQRQIMDLTWRYQSFTKRGGIHERIQAEIQHEDKEAKAMAEGLLDAQPAWNEVPDLMMAE